MLAPNFCIAVNNIIHIYFVRKTITLAETTQSDKFVKYFIIPLQVIVAVIFSTSPRTFSGLASEIRTQGTISSQNEPHPIGELH